MGIQLQSNRVSVQLRDILFTGDDLTKHAYMTSSRSLENIGQAIRSLALIGCSMCPSKCPTLWGFPTDGRVQVRLSDQSRRRLRSSTASSVERSAFTVLNLMKYKCAVKKNLSNI